MFKRNGCIFSPVVFFKISVWWGVKFLPGGHSTFFGFVNTFVHVVIYSYFLTITLFPATRRIFFWWKTFYPFFQIAQFLLIFVHAFQLLWKNECNYPIAFVYFIGGHAVLFYVLVMQKMVSCSKIVRNRTIKKTPNYCCRNWTNKLARWTCKFQHGNCRLVRYLHNVMSTF